MLRSSAIVRLAVVGIASALFFGAPAHAQTAPGATPGVEGELERVAATTPAEKVEYSESALAEMNEAGKAVLRMLEAARRETGAGAAEKVQCLTNRLTTIRALYDVSKKANTKMTEFLGANQQELADHEFRKIAVGLSRSRQALFEAERCGRPDTGVDGQTDVIVEGGDGGDGDDLIGDYIDVDIILEDISPFE